MSLSISCRSCSLSHWLSWQHSSGLCLVSQWPLEQGVPTWDRISGAATSILSRKGTITTFWLPVTLLLMHLQYTVCLIHITFSGPFLYGCYVGSRMGLRCFCWTLRGFYWPMSQVSQGPSGLMLYQLCQMEMNVIASSLLSSVNVLKVPSVSSVWWLIKILNYISSCVIPWGPLFITGCQMDHQDTDYYSWPNGPANFQSI